MRALSLDDEARERLGSNVMVTRDESRIFLYAASEAQVREAERVIGRLVDADELTAEIRVTRWHPVEEAWKDASIPLPTSSQEEAAELAAREAAEAREAEIEGDYDWHVVVHVPGRGNAIELERRLAAEGLPVRRRWRYVTVGVLTEERADELWLAALGLATFNTLFAAANADPTSATIAQLGPFRITQTALVAGLGLGLRGGLEGLVGWCEGRGLVGREQCERTHDESR